MNDYSRYFEYVKYNAQNGKYTVKYVDICAPSSHHYINILTIFLGRLESIL